MANTRLVNVQSPRSDVGQMIFRLNAVRARARVLFSVCEHYTQILDNISDIYYTSCRWSKVNVIVVRRTSGRFYRIIIYVL